MHYGIAMGIKRFHMNLFDSLDVFKPIFIDFRLFRFLCTHAYPQKVWRKSSTFDRILAQSRDSGDISPIFHALKEGRADRGRGCVRIEKFQNQSKCVQTTLDYHRNSYGTVPVPPDAIMW